MGLFTRKVKQTQVSPQASGEDDTWNMMEGLVNASESLKAQEVNIDPALEPYAEALRNEMVKTQMLLFTDLTPDADELLNQAKADIEAAQERLANGTYGTCLTCGQQISPEQLHELPRAVHCIQCQPA